MAKAAEPCDVSPAAIPRMSIHSYSPGFPAYIYPAPFFQNFAIAYPQTIMYFLNVVLFLAVAAVADISCNGDPDLKNGTLPLSAKCNNAVFTGDTWLNVDCEVRTKSGTFGIDLNKCIVNNNFRIEGREK